MFSITVFAISLIEFSHSVHHSPVFTYISLSDPHDNPTTRSILSSFYKRGTKQEDQPILFSSVGQNLYLLSKFIKILLKFTWALVTFSCWWSWNEWEQFFLWKESRQRELGRYTLHKDHLVIFKNNFLMILQKFRSSQILNVVKCFFFCKVADYNICHMYNVYILEYSISLLLFFFIPRKTSNIRRHFE